MTSTNDPPSDEARPDRPVSVLYCFSHKDADLQQELADQLAVLARAGAIVTWSHREISPGSDWRQAIEQQLDSAEIILLLLTKNFFGSRFCCEIEMTRALQRREDGQARVIPILLGPCDWQNSPVGKLQVLPGVTPVVDWNIRDQAWMRVAEGVRKAVAGVARQPSSTRTAPITPQLIPPLKTLPSLERPDVIQEIHEAFEHATPTRVVCLYGLTGIGKSSLAIQYAQRSRSHYCAMFFVNASDEHRLREGFYEIATRALHLRLKEPQSLAEGVAAARRWLDEHSGWLLILDDANSKIVKGWIPSSDGDVLITSHGDMQGLQHPPDCSICVRELTEAEALAFFQESTGRILAAAEMQAAAEIACALGFVPSALEQAAAFIRGKHLRFTSYLERLRARPVEAVEMLPSLQLAVESAEADGELTQSLLRLLAVLDGKQISLDLFGRDALQTIGPPLGNLHADWEIEAALSPLISYSLISFDPSRGIYRIKPLVQEAILLRMPAELQRSWAERAVTLVSQSIGGIEFSTWPQHSGLFPQVRAAVKLIERYQFDTLPALRLLNKAGFFLIQQGEYARASQCYQMALRAGSKTGIDELRTAAGKIDLADSLNGIGRVLYHLGDYRAAEVNLLDALQIRRESLGGDHAETATSLNNLAVLYSQMDPVRDDIELMFRQALTIREDKLGLSHPYVAKTLNNLGLILTIRGGETNAGPDETLLTEAESIHQRALDLRVKVLGPGHSDVAQSFSGLARVARARRDFAKAEALYRKARVIDEEALGRRHPNVGYCILGLARTYAMQKRNDLALSSYEDTLSIFRPALGDGHPHVAKCIFALAVLHEAERPKDARQGYAGALAMWEKTVSNRHPDYLACLRRLSGLTMGRS